MKALASAVAALAVLLTACVQPNAPKQAEAPPPPVTLIGEPPFMPGTAPAAPSVAEAATETRPDVALEAAPDAAALFRRLCPAEGAAPAPDLALATRHPTAAEIDACARRGIALTSVQLAGPVRPENPEGAFLVYDAARLRPEARPVVDGISENRVALFDRPGYAEAFQVRS